MRGSDFYGIQNIFCLYAGVFFRGFFPYAVQHGWQVKATGYESIDSPAEIWVWSERVKLEMTSYFDAGKIRVVGSPYLYLPPIAQQKEPRDVGIYVMPHSSHFAKIGFSNSDLANLLVSLKLRHDELTVLIYYLDVTHEICELMRRQGVRILLCGGLWSQDFMHKFRSYVRDSVKVYYSNFGSAVLFAQYEKVEVQYVPLNSRIEHSTNAHVNELTAVAAQVQSAIEYDFEVELGVGKKMDESECRELLVRGYRSAPKVRSAKKIIANCKNRVTDYLSNLRPALRLVEQCSSHIDA